MSSPVAAPMSIPVESMRIEKELPPSAAAGAFRRPSLGELCLGVFLAVLIGFSVPLDEHLHNDAMLMEDDLLMSEPTCAATFLSMVQTSVCPVLVEDFVGDAVSDLETVPEQKEQGSDDDEEQGYSAEGFLRDLRSLLSFFLGVVVCAPSAKMSSSQSTSGAQRSSASRRRRRSERRTRMQENGADDAELSDSDSESEGEDDDRSKKLKLYLYMM